MAPTWEENFSIVESGLDLTPEQIRWSMEEILTGRADIENIKRFLLSLREKGETPEEVGALIAQLFEHSSPITISERAVDRVGIGGDGANTINISTTAAIIAAAAGARVVKHGNRAASSQSGAADLLEALGVNITLDGVGVARTVGELGIGFCFAPVFHPAMRHAAPARKELGKPTVFNILGPLANPAKPQAAAIGVANERMHLVMAQVLADRGVDGFVFRGRDGLDEITLATSTEVLSIGTGTIESDELDPTDFGIDKAPVEALVGGDARENARITLSIFAGERGAHRDAVLLNAAAAIAAFKGDLTEDIRSRFEDGLEAARDAVDTGKATALLDKWVHLSNSIGKS